MAWEPQVLAKQEEEKEDNVVDLKLLQGGKEPPSTGETWLDKKELGSVFLIKDKTNPMSYALEKFMLIGRVGKASFLRSPSLPQEICVDTVAFCNKFREFEDLGVISTHQEEQEGGVDGDSNRIEGDGGSTVEEVEGPTGK